MFWKKKKKALEISNLAFQGSFIVHRREAQRDKCVQLLHKRRNFPLQEAQVSTLFKNPKAFSEVVKVYQVQAVLMMQDEFMGVNNAITENPACFFLFHLHVKELWEFLILEPFSMKEQGFKIKEQ